MKLYRCKHAVEAMRWTDTDEDRESFAAWFDEHDALFETRGPEITLPLLTSAGLATADPCAPHTASVGEWVVFSDGEFIAMDDEMFSAEYEAASTSTSAAVLEAAIKVRELRKRQQLLSDFEYDQLDNQLGDALDALDAAVTAQEKSA